MASDFGNNGQHAPKNIVLLGATGSIGASTLRVLRAHPDKLRLIGIAGASRYRELAAIAREFNVAEIALFDHQACREARQSGLFPPSARIHAGLEGLQTIACLDAAELVVTAVVGTQSLQPTLAAIAQGKDIALASKEILVMAGKFVMAAAREKGVSILPLDSEHNAIFQCLQGNRDRDVAKLILTASGGPFRDWPIERMDGITPQDALRHPNWDMGPKITIDSSTMANKGLELIEAHWLFQKGREQIDVVIHPQSIIHSMVQYVDGSIIAQLAPPSMTFAIQHALLHPERADGVDAALDFRQSLQLDFHAPDFTRFPCLRLAIEAMEMEGISPAVFNAANEIAVQAFIDGQIGYTDIAKTIAAALDKCGQYEPSTLEDILQADRQAREYAADGIRKGRPIRGSRPTARARG